MGLIEILTFCVVILSLSLIYTLYKLLRFSMILISLEDAIEECLDLFDERYKTVSEILEIPVFFDSTEVRRVVNEIRLSRDALAVVANKLTESYGRKIEFKEEDSQEEKEV
tara:strand:- start:192 stop:524 length:333 start_codon:yes stop_codon:yes gene_type:complete